MNVIPKLKLKVLETPEKSTSLAFFFLIYNVAQCGHLLFSFRSKEIKTKQHEKRVNYIINKFTIDRFKVVDKKI